MSYMSMMSYINIYIALAYVHGNQYNSYTAVICHIIYTTLLHFYTKHYIA